MFLNRGMAEKTVTILLLGEARVGKSTFINAFANYLRHHDISEAENDVTCLIPSYYTLITEDGPKIITLGRESQHGNGDLKDPEPRCYDFSFGDTTVNLIDTPSIGDTSGPETDSLNLRSLLRFIEKFQDINAICILLKPNKERFTVSFRYYILEFLSALKRSAKDNIVFFIHQLTKHFFYAGKYCTHPTQLSPRYQEEARC